MRGRMIAAEQALVDGFAGEVAALQREHHAAAEGGIEKGEGVTHEQQAGSGAIARVAAVFAGDEVVARLAATSQVILNPEILADLAFENGFRRFHPVAR